MMQLNETVEIQNSHMCQSLPLFYIASLVIYLVFFILCVHQKWQPQADFHMLILLYLFAKIMIICIVLDYKEKT